MRMKWRKQFSENPCSRIGKHGSKLTYHFCLWLTLGFLYSFLAAREVSQPQRGTGNSFTFSTTTTNEVRVGHSARHGSAHALKESRSNGEVPRS